MLANISASATEIVAASVTGGLVCMAGAYLTKTEDGSAMVRMKPHLTRCAIESPLTHIHVSVTAGVSKRVLRY